jgi:hypothetical protein
MNESKTFGHPAFQVNLTDAQKRAARNINFVNSITKRNFAKKQK